MHLYARVLSVPQDMKAALDLPLVSVFYRLSFQIGQNWPIIC